MNSSNFDLTGFTMDLIGSLLQRMMSNKEFQEEYLRFLNNREVFEAADLDKKEFETLKAILHKEDLAVGSLREILLGAGFLKEVSTSETQSLTFSLDGDTQEGSKLIVNNTGDNATFNFNIDSTGESKIKKIERNLGILATKGISFERLTTYHLKVSANNELWNFYPSTEKFHRDGLPTEGKGMDNFLTVIGHKG